MADTTPLNVVDPYTLEPIDTLPFDDRVLVYDKVFTFASNPNSGGTTAFMVRASSLLKDLKKQFDVGTELFSLGIDAKCNDKIRDIQTNRYVWRQLINRETNPMADQFKDFLLEALLVSY